MQKGTAMMFQLEVKWSGGAAYDVDLLVHRFGDLVYVAAVNNDCDMCSSGVLNINDKCFSEFFVGMVHGSISVASDPEGHWLYETWSATPYHRMRVDDLMPMTPETERFYGEDWGGFYKDEGTTAYMGLLGSYPVVLRCADGQWEALATDEYGYLMTAGYGSTSQDALDDLMCSREAQALC